jgi:iron complex transport system substrate-binding protein
MGYGCNPQNSSSQQANSSEANEYTSYADKYAIELIGTNHLVKVFSPWQNAGHSELSYLLGNDPSTVPDSLKDIPFIKTPVQRVVLMSTTFISIIDALDELQSLAGISGSKYVFNQDLRERIDEGKVVDVGYDKGLNYELLIEIEPDVLFLYGVEAGVSQTINKLHDLGIPVVMCADYLEQEPLGRAEWLKFFGLFYEKYDLANERFKGIASRYDSIREIASDSDHSPSVFVGLPWKDTWYIAGGQSYAAEFIKDAGGSYVWGDLETTEAEPHDLESVYSKILDADIWINSGVAESLQSILNHDTRFMNLKAWEEGQVFNNNLRTNDFGGNDYWESGIIHPDIILGDLVNIFHMGKDSLYYYKRLR